MSLVDHIDVEQLEEELLELQKKGNQKNKLHSDKNTHEKYSKYRPHPNEVKLGESYINKYNSTERIPKFRIPQSGILPGPAYQLLHDALALDGRPLLNLASFVNTYVSEESRKLINENISKNLADNDEYPALIDLVQRCVSILGGLWEVPKGEKAVGSPTTGSSEAIMLGGLSMKRRWEQKRKDEGKDFSKPNIIMASSVQVALEKFARYFDVASRVIPVSRESNYVLDLAKVREQIDENTIGIFAVLGSTYTGHFDNVEKLSDMLDEFEKETGIDIPIHVDGASGAFVAPFLYPKLKWNFKLPRVKSINASGHKFGLTAVGLGWIIWRNRELLPDNLIFQLKYLGAVEESYTLNFSRPGYQVIHQYYLFIHLGRDGYKKIHSGSLSNARLLSRFLEATGYFECLSDIHRPKGSTEFDPESVTPSLNGQNITPFPEDPEVYNEGLPVVSFKFTDKFKEEFPEIPQAAVSALLRAKGFIIPNYPLPPSEQDTEILRVVCRMSLTLDLMDQLMTDIVHSIESLIKAVLASRSIEHNDEQVKMLRASINALVLTDDKPQPHQRQERQDNINESKNKVHHSYRGTC